MKQIVFALAFMSLAAAHQAQACNTNQTLKCQGTFLASGKVVLTGTAADHLADEHWDEPSEANCAATVYLTNLHNTSVRIYAVQDGSQVNYDTVASQTYRDDQNNLSGDYSKVINVTLPAGKTNAVGTLHLPNPVSYGTAMSMVTDVAISCSVR